MTSDAVKRLATAVSLAARIEPELLRALRLRLFPDMDVSAEGDLWFSDLVASRSARRIVLDQEVVSSLRQSFESDRPLLYAARAVVEEIHRNAPPAIQLEEEIIYLALTGESVEGAINTKLTSVLNAIVNEERRGLIDWVARALPGMPSIVQNTTAAAALRLVAGGQASGALHVSYDPAVAALIDRAVPKTKVFARLVLEHDGLSIEISRVETPASHEIELPKTEPLVLELTTFGQAEVVDVPREGTLLRQTERRILIRTIAGDVFHLEEARPLRPLNALETSLPGVLILEPRVFADERGWFAETFNSVVFHELGLPTEFAQENHSHSVRDVVRGLHYQLESPQGKIVRCVRGAILDVAVDIRRSSPTFGKWVGVELSAENRRMLWIPPGFAHGFSILSDGADVLYKCTTAWHQPSDRGLLWNDPDLAIDWRVESPQLSPIDAAGKRLREAEVFE